MPKTLLALATYNERENLEPLVRSILALGIPDLDILVIDDNSPDGTGALAEELATRHPQLSVLHREGKLGLGTAHVAAMRRAIEGRYDFLVTMDADFSHHPRYLSEILARAGDNDLVIGSRYVPGGGSEHWGRLRLLMSLGANAYARLLLGLKPRDCSGAFRCYRVAMLERAGLDDIVARGYAFQEEMVFRIQLLGGRIEEVPIVFRERRGGKSKMSAREVVGLLVACLRLRWRQLRGRLPRAPAA